MRRRKLIIGLLLTCIGVAFSVVQLGFETSAKQGKIVDCEIKSNYVYGNEFEIPDGKVSYNGKEKDAERKYVVYPSGKANENETITLSEDGKYEVVFQSKFNGVMVTAKESFIVNKRLFAVNDERSSAQLKDEKIQVSLASDDAFTYNEAIDLSKSSVNAPLLSIAFNPNALGTADASAVCIRLTDLYDEDNYVTVKIKDVSREDVVYLVAAAANQPFAGVQNTDHPELTQVHINNRYGTPIYCSLAGKTGDHFKNEMKLYFDYEKRAFYVDNEVYSGGKNRLLIDLDEVEYFGADLWEGFKTGEAKLTIFAENYQSSSCNFVIDQINGESDFSVLGDVENPNVTVDLGYDLENLPKALVGKPYRVFDAIAFDKYDGEVSVATAAYYKYYSENPVKLSVVDGAFTPMEAGTYVIEYTAEDSSGNVGTECVKIQAVEGEGLQVALNDVIKETNTGQAVKLMSGISYTDNSGNVSYSVTAKNKSTKEEMDIDKDTLEFIPMSDGDWEVTVAVSDYVSTVSETFDVKANHTTQPQVYDNTSVPKYFMLGATYNMSTLSGYDFSSGKGVAVEMDTFVTESDGTEKQLKGNEYIPENSGAVTVTYRLTVDGKTCEKSYTATVIDVGYTGDLDLTKFFAVTEGAAEAEATATNITYRVNGDTKFDFINLVQVKRFKISFQVGEENQYNKINLYLSDAITGKQIKMSYRRMEEGSAFSINDGTEYILESSFDGMNRNFTLEFSNDACAVSPGSNVSVEVEKFFDGSKFKGFSDSLAFLAVELEEVSGASQLVVNNINSHSLNNTRIDRFAPEIIVETNSGDRGYGEEVEIKGAFVYDTVNPISSVTMEVFGPNGDYVKDKEGILLDGKQDPTKDYTIELSKYGDYTIQYIATDGAGKSEEYVYAITSKDITRPELTLKRHKTSAKKGDEVKIAKTKVEDNRSKECDVFSYVFDPTGANVKVTDGKFEATMSGTYQVRYMAFDEAGNCTFVSYEIDVK